MDAGRLEVRDATADDLGTLVALVQRAYRGEASRAGWTTEADLLDGQRVDADMVAATLADATTLVRVAELDATAVGCYELRSSDGADAATFGMFAVEPTHQAAGLGGLLLADAEQVARRRQGERRLRMTVIAQRAELIDWYGRRGYLPTGAREPFPYGDERFGRPRRDDLEFVVLAKDL